MHGISCVVSRMSEPRRLTAADIMTKRVVTGGPNSEISEIAVKMQRNKIGSVVIIESGKVIGIVTERDFVRVTESVAAMLDKNRARHYMTKPVVTVQPDMLVADVIDLMKDKNIRHVVVLDKSGELAGVISSRDLTKATMGAVSTQ